MTTAFVSADTNCSTFRSHPGYSIVIAEWVGVGVKGTASAGLSIT